MRKTILLPAKFATQERQPAGRIRQLEQDARRAECEIEVYPQGKIPGHLARHDDGTVTLILPRRRGKRPDGVHEILYSKGGWEALLATNPGGVAEAEWIAPEGAREDRPATALEGRPGRVRASWIGRFAFREEVVEGDATLREGLRPPQIGALHAAIAHWRVTDDLATVVMPTGTGKTETMLALLVAERLERLLVVVPTAALREQIAAKFLRLGLLRRLGAVAAGADYPVVGTLEHRPKTPREAADFFLRCNVVVTTMAILGGCGEAARRRITEVCSHLFLDEAHHSQAKSWEEFRQLFRPRPVLQFTATPFRGDGKHVDGRVIFSYPLRKAQEGGYFKRINFLPVSEFDPRKSDRAIAGAAVLQLEKDIAAGYSHVVMARVGSIARAERVLEIYKEIAAGHDPLMAHSGQSARETRAAIERLRSGSTRIVVCVNMLGEGFDLPELKIAALHDIHKSLAITLQFTGRFTRARPDLGEATMIANVADAAVEESMQELYAEDPDWNLLIRDLSEGATGKQARRSDFLQGFGEVPRGLSLQNVFPKMSTVIYRTKCRKWRPEGIREAINPKRLHLDPVVNPQATVAVFVTRELEPIPWGNIKEIQNVVWDLYIVHWEEERDLLYIHSSNKGGHHESLAEAIAGKDATLVRGERVFRVFHGVNRLLLMNLGLTYSLSRAVRFSMHVGSDIFQALSEGQLQNKVKSNVFGRGFEGGAPATVGCSSKGRIWSYRAAENIADWVDWSRRIGAKVLDDSITNDDFMKHVIRPKEVAERPPLVPLTVEWSDELLCRSEEALLMDVVGDVAPFYEVGLELVGPKATGPLRFRVFTEAKSVEYEVIFQERAVRYKLVRGVDVEIVSARRRRKLSEWFQGEPPIIRFEDGAFLIYNDLFEIPGGARTPFDPDRIEAWDWTGTDITKESQRVEKRQDSIQYRVIRDLCNSTDPDYDIVFNDDETNEAADVIAMKVAGDDLIVDLFHCKYSQGEKPGSRVEDLYEVCGQAQRSVFRKGHVGLLIEHMRARDARWVDRKNATRFQKGDLSTLAFVAGKARFLNPKFTIAVVQPGLLQPAVEDKQLDLLAVTEMYLRETYAVDFRVIGSK